MPHTVGVTDTAAASVTNDSSIILLMLLCFTNTLLGSCDHKGNIFDRNGRRLTLSVLSYVQKKKKKPPTIGRNPKNPIFTVSILVYQTPSG